MGHFKIDVCILRGQKLVILPMDSSKKLTTGGERGKKSGKFADVLNGWSLIKHKIKKHYESIFPFFLLHIYVLENLQMCKHQT